VIGTWRGSYLDPCDLKATVRLAGAHDAGPERSQRVCPAPQIRLAAHRGEELSGYLRHFLKQRVCDWVRVPGALTTWRVNFWWVVPAEFVAVSFSRWMPTAARNGHPAMMAVPLPVSANFRPSGSDPLSVIFGSG
jgi:hypothetical protein